jgi:MFS family permease
MGQAVNNIKSNNRLSSSKKVGCDVGQSDSLKPNDVVRFTDSATSSSASSTSSSSSSSSEHWYADPPDGGWGWAVVAASFTAHLIADGISASVGILYAELLDVFGGTKAETAWVGSLFLSMPALCGPIASILTNQFGCRRSTIAGGIIAAVGCVLASFATNLVMVCLFFGVVAGFGLSLVYMPAVIIVAFYFEKKRALATG